MARAKGDIDPRRETIDPAKAKRPRRRIRTKPDPLPAVEQDRQRAVERMEQRPASPGVMLEARDDGGLTITSPHSDLALWELQLGDAFGTRSQSVVRTFLRDLKRLCSQDWDEANGLWKANETELNAALAMVADVRPETTIEAALAAQMVAVHWMQMRLTKQALNNGGMVMERDAALASKLARTFVMQMEALRLAKGGNKSTHQTFTIQRETHDHRHIHYHQESQENDGQPDAPNYGTGTVPKRAALPGANEAGEVVPFASGLRQARLPDARGTGRRTEGEG